MEAIYKILFSSIGEGVIISNSKGNIIEANPRSHELFGYKEGELIGKSVGNLIPTELRGNHDKHISDYQKNPTQRRMGSNINLLAQRKDGSKFYVEISLNHFINNGESQIAAIITDITLRVEQQNKIKELNQNLEKKVEVRTNELKDSQELYRAIARNFPNGTINVFDKDLNYIFVEGKELHENGIKSELLIGTSYIDKLSKELRPRIKKALLNVFEGKKEDFEIYFKNHYYNINAVPLKNNKGEIDRILSVEKNITEQKLIQDQQREALEHERQLSDMKSRFVSMASHEFRTPLSTILSSVSLIEKYIEKERLDKTLKHTQRIKKSVQSLTGILNDFLSADKLENKKEELIISEFNYEIFAEEIAEELGTICKTDQVLEYHFEGKNPNIVSDQKVLKNILYNLISNAIKYSNKGQKIIFSSAIYLDKLVIIVEDFGVGIPKAEQEQLFTRFFRATNVFNIEGTGLGLHIVKKYLDKLEGEITFESEEGKGTRFEISIPINKTQ